MSTVEDDDRTRNTHSIQVLKALILASVAVEGAYKYVPGPTLIDLVSRIPQPFEDIILVYCARAIGQIIGIILGSFIFQWLLLSNQKSLFLFLSTFIMSSTSVFISIMNEFDGILCLFCAAGFTKGLLDTGINAICLHSKFFGRIFFCLLSCFYSFGALLSSVLAKYYVEERVNITSETLENQIKNDTEIRDAWKNPTEESISMVYISIAVWIFLISFLWLFHYNFASSHVSVTEPEFMDSKQDFSAIIWNLVIINASIISFMSEAIAFGYSQILPSYLVILFDINQPESIDCLIIFLGFCCIGRIATTIFSSDFFTKSSPNILIFVSIFVLYCGVLVLYIDKEYTRPLFLIANGVLGIGVGPMFISNYLWLCCKIFITHRSMNPLFIMESLSELIFPWLLSKFVWKNPENMPHFIVAVTTITAVLYIIQYIFLASNKKQCPDCTRRSISEAMPLPTVQGLNVPERHHGLQGQCSESSEEAYSLEFLKFVNRQKVFDDFSEVEKRIQETNLKVKSAISQLEYSAKP